MFFTLRCVNPFFPAFPGIFFTSKKKSRVINKKTLIGQIKPKKLLFRYPGTRNGVLNTHMYKTNYPDKKIIDFFNYDKKV